MTNKIEWLLAEEIDGFIEQLNSENNGYFFDKPTRADLAGVRLFKLVRDKETVAYFGLDKWTKDTLCLCYLYVKTKYRKKGIGKFIINYIINRNKNNNKYIYGICNSSNYKALEFYRKIGLKSFAREEDSEIEIIIYQ